MARRLSRTPRLHGYSHKVQGGKRKASLPWKPLPEHDLPLVALREATIYQDHPSRTDNVAPIFPRLSFSIDSSQATKERWAVTFDVASPITSQFLHVLRGKYASLPPTSRVWPYLASNEFESLQDGNDREPSRALRYVGFSNQRVGPGGAGTQGAYLGARYESRRENTDWSLLDYLRGTVGLNLSPEELRGAVNLEQDSTFKQVIDDFKLRDLLSLPVGSLSNGQTRRARIAKSLLAKPQLLLLDEPFAGLDPANMQVLSNLLRDLADRHAPRILLALPSAEVPDWITHVLRLDPDGEIQALGEKLSVYKHGLYMPEFTPQVLPPRVPKAYREINSFFQDPEGGKGRRKYSYKDPMRERRRVELLKSTGGLVDRTTTRTRTAMIHRAYPEAKRREMVRQRRPGFQFWDHLDPVLADSMPSEPLVEMQGVKVNYGDKCVLGNWTQKLGDGQREEGLHWQVRQGDRWGIFGPNGSGKTTIISLLTSDHPQAYSLPIKLFGRPRLPSPGQPGISIFDIQSRIGHASPELHTFFPKSMTVRQVIENAWADAFHSRPSLTYEQDKQVQAALRWFRKELDPSQVTEADRLSRYYRRPPERIRLIRHLAYRLNIDYPDKRASDGRITELRRDFLAWLQDESEWADGVKLSELSLSAQKVALFLRAVIKKPDIVVLDEAFSGMDQQSMRKCMLFLAHGDQKWLGSPPKDVPGFEEKVDTAHGALQTTSTITGLEPRQALVCISHRQAEVPFVVDRWLRLPEANEGQPVEFGTVDRSKDWWSDVWGVRGNGVAAAAEDARQT